jgi:hypothetical protein
MGEMDVDGALEESIAALHGESRATFLRRAFVGSALLLGAGAAPAQAAAARRDEAILNYALTLEYIQEAFYGEVERIGALKGGLAEQARVVGAMAAKRPRFDFRGATENGDRFRRTAVAFEDLAVAAYKAQAPLIQRRAYLVPALAIHTVEARHAAWIRRLAGLTPAADAFDQPRSKKSTLGIVASTKFEVMQASSRRRPKFTG